MRIDKLVPGDIVTLGFCLNASNTMDKGRIDFSPAMFVEITGTGDDRRAKFISEDDYGTENFYEWEAYRYNGHWAFGSSANRLRLLSLDIPATA